jgi:hypothetical protein
MIDEMKMENQNIFVTIYIEILHVAASIDVNIATLGVQIKDTVVQKILAKTIRCQSWLDV